MMRNIESPILRPKQAAAYIGMSLPSFWRLARQDHEFPRTFKIGLNATAILKKDLDAWIASKKEQGAMK